MNSDSPFFRFPLNVSGGGAPPPPPLPLPSEPATPFYPSDFEFDAESSVPCYKLDQTAYAELLGHFRLIVQVLAVVIMSASVLVASVAIALIFTVKRLQLLIGVLRSQTRTEGVSAGLLEADAAELADDPAQNGGARGAAGRGAKKSRRHHTDTENTSCALEGVDEEEDHRL